MRTQITSILLIVLATGTLQQVTNTTTPTSKGACTPGMCASCQVSSAGQSYCASCYKSNVVGDTAQFTSYCQGPTTVSGCAITSQISSVTKCMACDTNHTSVRDATGGPVNACIAIQSTLANCQRAEQIGTNTPSCSECQKGFFVKSGACVAVTKPIANCQTYRDDGVCSFCESGFALDLSTSLCSTSAFTGCAFIQTGKCAQCRFQNSYFATSYNTTTNQVCTAEVSSASSLNPLTMLTSFISQLQTMLEGILKMFDITALLKLFGNGTA